MLDVEPNQASAQRRRSERVSKSVPLVVRGIDLLGQPFEERTSTLALNLNGCRYSSKHHLPKNTWVTLELPQGGQRRNVRARVAWIQRPHSVREFFQIAVELESPANVWGIEAPPADWSLPEPAATAEQEAPEQGAGSVEGSAAGAAAATMDTATERTGADMTNPFFESAAAAPLAPTSGEGDAAGTVDSPLSLDFRLPFAQQRAVYGPRCVPLA